MASAAHYLQSLLQSTEPAILNECLSTAAHTLGYTKLKPNSGERVRLRDYSPLLVRMEVAVF